LDLAVAHLATEVIRAVEENAAWKEEVLADTTASRIGYRILTYYPILSRIGYPLEMLSRRFSDTMSTN
jgi:hypothetical protein